MNSPKTQNQTPIQNLTNRPLILDNGQGGSLHIRPGATVAVDTLSPAILRSERRKEISVTRLEPTPPVHKGDISNAGPQGQPKTATRKSRRANQ